MWVYLTEWYRESCETVDMIQEATHITPLKKGKDVLPQSRGESMEAPTTYIPSTKRSYHKSGLRPAEHLLQNAICPQYWRMAYIQCRSGTILLKK
jgi:hypothetical protein